MTMSQQSKLLYFFSTVTFFFHVGTGPLYIKAFALRGTLYTLISEVDEAIHDLTQVVNADDEKVSIKVDCHLVSARF